MSDHVDRRRKAEDLFLSALEYPPGERPTFLREACADDPALRREVSSLLEADHRASGFLERAVAAEAELLIDSGDQGRLGQRVGPYRLQRVLGRGGMSVVYLAVRDDEEYRQNVAIKVLKRGMDSDEIARRFRQERQILAHLEHPAIARLLDGGTTEDGLSYLVMEHIEGRPIDEYCAGEKLAIEKRLRLFADVCEAVHFAHQNLVVHRDLKPSNILVTARGAVKLLDFGIAKLLDAERSPVTLVETARAARVMTPEYASPEQVRGEIITTASDIYSLGVLLYEMLVGRRPYRLGTRSPREIERIICQEDPTRPSTAVGHGGGPAGLVRRLAGDLDTIVQRAMQKDPHRRYNSAEQLLRDVELHLAGRPILARKDSLRYRATKFLRRHRLGVAVAVLVLATLTASAFVTAWQARAARRAQVRAEAALVQVEAEKDNAQEVLSFVEGLFEVADPEIARGREITVREMLERGAREIASRLDEQPAAQARLMGSMGRIHHHLGLYDEAARLQERALAFWRQERLDAEIVAGLNQLAETFYEKGDSEEAERLCRQALDVGRKLWGQSDDPRLADSLDHLGVVLLKRGDAAAENHLRAALKMRLRLFGNAHDTVARSLHNLGSLHYGRGELPEAETLLRRSLRIKEELWGETHPKIAPTLSNLASLHYKTGDYPAAASEFRRVLELRRKLLGEEHVAVARTLANLATVLSLLGENEEALAMHREALAAKRRLLRRGDPSIAMSLLGLGKALASSGRPEEAEASLRESLELLRRALPAGHPALGEPLASLGRLMFAGGERREAEPLLREAYEIYLGQRGEHDPETRAVGEFLKTYESAERPTAQEG